MSLYQLDDVPTRSILAATLMAIDRLSSTLDALLKEQSSTSSTLERLRLQVKEKELKSKSLDSIIETTRCSRARMETVAEDLRSLLSPMKTLPTETLVQIFLTALELQDHERRGIASMWHTPNPDRSALLLSQVCTRWRAIFSREPQLWKHVDFHVRRRGKINKGDIERFRYYVRHGVPGQQSLFIPDWSLEKHKILLETLKVTLSKSKMPFTTVKMLEMDMIEDPEGRWDIQALQADEVTIYRSHRTRTLGFVIPLIRSASKVTICGNPCVNQWANPPWMSLRTLIINEFSQVTEGGPPGFTFSRLDFMRLLSAAPFLENLELTFRVDEATLACDNETAATHAYLASLTVHLHHFVGGKGLFGVHLDLPALRKIKFLSLHCSLASWDNDQFIYRLNTPTTLILPELGNHELNLATELLRWLPDLQKLELAGKNVDSLLGAVGRAYHVVPPVLRPISCPALTKLHFKNADVRGGTLLAFLRTKLQQRRAGTEGFYATEYIEAYEATGIGLPDWEIIREVLEEGRVANTIL